MVLLGKDGLKWCIIIGDFMQNEEEIKCGFCGRPSKYIPNVLDFWCNAWCWCMDTNTPYRPSKEAFLKIIQEMKDKQGY